MAITFALRGKYLRARLNVTFHKVLAQSDVTSCLNGNIRKTFFTFPFISILFHVILAL